MSEKFFTNTLKVVELEENYKGRQSAHVWKKIYKIGRKMIFTSSHNLVTRRIRNKLMNVLINKYVLRFSIQLSGLLAFIDRSGSNSTELDMLTPVAKLVL
jgi:hypothetical protein